MVVDVTFVLTGLVIVTGAIALTDLCLLLCWSHARHSETPTLIDCSRILFPVLLIVLCLRIFVVSPYRVPTGSLEPTVLPGDVVLVMKAEHHKPIVRGEIIAFKHPVNQRATLLKRVIGLPGDHISYINKILYINGQKVNTQFIHVARGAFSASSQAETVDAFQETINGVSHQIYVEPHVVPVNFYNLVVPKDSYFVLGDNRDSSDDSRYWGFVNSHDIIGYASRVGWSWDARAPSFLHRVRWQRIGEKLV